MTAPTPATGAAAGAITEAASGPTARSTATPTAAMTAVQTTTSTTGATSTPTAAHTTTSTTGATSTPTAAHTTTSTTGATSAPTAAHTTTSTTGATSAPTAAHATTSTTRATSTPTAAPTDRGRRRDPLRLRALGAAAVAAVVLLGVLGGAGAGAAQADDDIPITVTVPGGAPAQGDGSITNAELRWGLNREASSGAFAGGCNFLSAGVAGDTGSSRVWTEADALYSAQSGAVTIEKATASGTWQTADFANRCIAPDGSAVSVTSLTSSTQSQVVIDGGTGSVSATGGLQVAWRGSFTVAFYGGMTYWSATDPTLALDAAGNGQLTATLSGYGASMDDPGKWVPVSGRTVVLAELRNVSLTNAGGFGSIPEYLGVQSVSGLQPAPSAQNATYWGSFPSGFMAFQELTGQAGYWQTTGGQRDPAKPATLLLVNYDADAPAIVPTAEGAAPGAAAPSNPLNTRPAGTPAAAAAPTGGTVAAAAGAAGAGGGSRPTFLPIIAVRDGGGLVPEVTAQGASPLLLPLLGAALALLVSLLLALRLAGRLPLPHPRRAR